MAASGRTAAAIPLCPAACPQPLTLSASRILATHSLGCQTRTSTSGACLMSGPRRRSAHHLARPHRYSPGARVPSPPSSVRGWCAPQPGPPPGLKPQTRAGVCGKGTTLVARQRSAFAPFRLCLLPFSVCLLRTVRNPRPLGANRRLGCTRAVPNFADRYCFLPRDRPFNSEVGCSPTAVGWRLTTVSCSSSSISVRALVDPQITRAGGSFLS